MNPGSIRSIKDLVIRVQFDDVVPSVTELLEVSLLETRW